MGYKSIGKYEVQEIIDLIKAPGQVAIIQGHRVRVSGARLQNFAINGTDCICCGAKGKYFSLEANGGGYHFNLYAISQYGKPVMMTRDHIKLKSLGGFDTVENYTPMCEKCNNKRANIYPDLQDFLNAYHNGTLISQKEHNRLLQGLPPKKQDNRPNSEKTYEELGRKQQKAMVHKWRVASCYSHVPLYWRHGYGREKELHVEVPENLTETF
jgi:hypothetical protein